MLDKFSSKAGKYIAIAESIAFDLGHCNVGSEHLLLSFLKIDNKLKKELEKYSLNFEKVKQELLEAFPLNEELPFYMEYTSNLKEIITESEKLSKSLNEDKVSEDVLMYSLIDKNGTLMGEILDKYGVDKKKLLEVLKVKKVSLLDGINELINLNNKMKINPTKVYKREKELALIENTLLKKQKANVLLVGDPGVGKSALVEYFAYKIIKGEVNKELKDKIIYEVDLSMTVAGTKYRGEFEEKVNKILKRAKDDNNAILFIDEIHNLIGAGGAEGAIDASNILKPYLARKDITCIGATTYDEYVKIIEKEKAINRRFMTIFLDEVSVSDCKEILVNLKEDYTSYHGIQIDEKICDYIVDSLEKYVREYKFPDKAIDTLDYASVLAKKNGNKALSKDDVNEAINSLFKVDLNQKNIFYLNKKLKSKIIGQDLVIDKVCENLSLSELKKENKPIGVYLFLGDSGVGKTELAKEIANNYFKENSYIKIDMENYSDPSSVSKLIGTSPGYIGYESDSYLFENIKKNPSSVIILDEIEKASSEVVNVFLNIFDEGYFIDSKKRKIDFRNSIIIMTSNLGFNKDKSSLGFNKIETNKEELDKLLKRFFKEELLNRIDDTFYFNKIEKDDYFKIARNYINEFGLDIDSGEILSKISYNSDGIRVLKKNIKNLINNEIIKTKNIKTKVS
jgi:ATP-dependent Clp protease ATP-binding subunit ClpA/ATP-dependent Clp protease ATP-binding subunit ClpC